MVFHVGIYSDTGQVAAYNTITKETINFSLYCSLRNGDSDTFDALFIRIKIETRGILGCACFYFSELYGNEFLKEIVNKGKSMGFKEIQFIFIPELIYLSLVPKVQKSFLNGVVWIIINRKCFIWKKAHKKAATLINDDTWKNIKEDYFLMIKKNSGLDINPTFIFYDNVLINTFIASSIFPTTKFYHYENPFDEKAEVALIKALIIANDPNVIQIANLLKMYFLKLKDIRVKYDGLKTCFVATVRKAGEYMATLSIDINQVFTFDLTNLNPILSIDLELHNGQIVVNQLQNNAKATIFDSKRIIGKGYKDVMTNSSWPFEVIKYNDRSVIKIHDSICSIGKYAEEVAAVLLKHIKQKCEEFQGKSVIEVVITIPASFTLKQKLATYMAASIAGFEKIHLLPEPVAASIAYFIDRPIPNNFTMLLFDFGGGTLDVCVFKIASNKLQIVCQAGDTNLGGRDFDNLLFNHFSPILKNEYKIDVRANDKLKYRLFQKCMEIKHSLTVENEARLDVSDFDTHVEKTITITRQKFESMSHILLSEIKKLIMNALSTTSYTSKGIHKVLLAGGSSRMPMVKHLLLNTFTKADFCCEENPDEVVAVGAAYYALYINSQSIHDSQTYNRVWPPPSPQGHHFLSDSSHNFNMYDPDFF